MSVNLGDIVATIRLNDEMSPAIELLGRLLNLLAPAAPLLSIPRALLGAAAAATQVTTPVSRRELLFPWTRRR